MTTPNEKDSSEKVKPKCRMTKCIYDYPPPGMGYLPRTYSGNAGRCEGCPYLEEKPKPVTGEWTTKDDYPGEKVKPKPCPECGGEVERFVNMSDEPVGALFIDLCDVCGRVVKVYEAEASSSAEKVKPKYTASCMNDSDNPDCCACCPDSLTCGESPSRIEEASE